MHGAIRVALVALSLWALFACGQRETVPPADEPARETPPEPVSETADDGPAEMIAAERQACESEEERAVDVARALPAAIAAIRAQEPAAPIPCTEPAPVCAGAPDGSRCVYELLLFPDVIRVHLWPEAADGAVVRAEAALARDLSRAVVPARVDAQRWGVAGAVRCRGESSQRSYGGGKSIAPVTIDRVRISCDNGEETARMLRVTGVTLIAPRRTETVLRAGEPHALPPGERTSITIAFEPVSLALRSANAFRVSAEVDGRTLSPVAQVTTPERMRRR